MDKQLEDILTKLNKLDDIEKGIHNMQADMQNLQSAFTLTQEKCIILEKICEEQSQSISKLERLIKKKNIVVYGIPETELNKNELENLLLEVFNKQLRLNLNTDHIEEIFRLGLKINDNRGKPRPILIIFNSIKAKNIIFQNRSKLQGTKIYIEHDLSYKDRVEKKKLIETKNKLIREGKNVKIIKNKIVTISESQQEKINDKRPRSSPTSEDNIPKQPRLQQPRLHETNSNILPFRLHDTNAPEPTNKEGTRQQHKPGLARSGQ